ncbi:LRR receptor-like serine/threonine-protein kinase [Drechslerella dactyloides]|uniref:LRR receptor-like serine/threonine-protein kinase n=1 Tax=Drechslerella dactyloides TaxID=74499 RepID=A0AAD6J4J0_DREDA|nr:LRR receptor-like serine/threonine-protein kinase [Drechslerella dactyloides]
MAGVELALAIVATVDIALKRGKQLVEICKAFRAAEREISALATRIEGSWSRTKYQLEFLEKVVYLMQDDLQRIQKDILDRLNETLNVTISQLERVISDSYSRDIDAPLEVKRFKYVFKKERLEKSVNDLESWQRLFDPTWFLIMTVASPIVDEKLATMNQLEQNHYAIDTDPDRTSAAASRLRSAREADPNPSGIFKSVDNFNQSAIVPIQSSSTFVAQRSDSGQYVILDPTPHIQHESEVPTLAKRVRDLARKLMNADPDEFGLLLCKGVIKNKDQNVNTVIGFTFVFEIPPSLSQPQSLKGLIADTTHHHSLSRRLKIAKDLARSVNYLHMFEYVHKNIRPANIIIFKDHESDMGAAFLVGFEDARPEDGRSQIGGDNDFEKNIYRHPSRQGLQPKNYYLVQHDIYSLGVCLLEIGLWTPLKNILEGISPRMFEEPSNTWEGSSAKDQFLHHARESLPSKMGTNYAKIVETCLTCLDPGNQDFGDAAALQDADGVMVSVRYRYCITAGSMEQKEEPQASRPPELQRQEYMSVCALLASLSTAKTHEELHGTIKRLRALYRINLPRNSVRLNRLLDRLASLLTGKKASDCVAVMISKLTSDTIFLLAAANSLTETANNRNGDRQRRESDIEAHAAKIFDFVKQYHQEEAKEAKERIEHQLLCSQVVYSLDTISVRFRCFQEVLRKAEHLNWASLKCEEVKRALSQAQHRFIWDENIEPDDKFISMFLRQQYLKYGSPCPELNQLFEMASLSTADSMTPQDFRFWHLAFSWAFQRLGKLLHAAKVAQQLQEGERDPDSRTVQELLWWLQVISAITSQSSIFRAWTSIIQSAAKDETTAHGFAAATANKAGHSTQTRTTNGHDESRIRAPIYLVGQLTRGEASSRETSENIVTSEEPGVSVYMGTTASGASREAKNLEQEQRASYAIDGIASGLNELTCQLEIERQRIDLEQEETGESREDVAANENDVSNDSSGDDSDLDIDISNESQTSGKEIDDPTVFAPPHAELLLLEYILTKSKYHTNYYIGLSKPPCFVCELILLKYSSMVQTRAGRAHFHVTAIPEGIPPENMETVFGVVKDIAAEVAMDLYVKEVLQSSERSGAPTENEDRMQGTRR